VVQVELGELGVMHLSVQVSEEQVELVVQLVQVVLVMLEVLLQTM
jgi:hypothetical protein